MNDLFDRLSDQLSQRWKVRNVTRAGRSFRCRCERSIFFRNSFCIGCQSPLGYVPELGELKSLTPGSAPDTWRVEGSDVDYRQCANLHTPAGCNWLVAATDTSTLCISCRLTRTIPDLSDPDNARYWLALETAKRRLVSQLLSLRLPVRSKVGEDPDCGLMFDFLRSPPGGQRVLTGHDEGLITLNAEEADDAKREQMRHRLHEPYRTLLGHFRHEVGHYYWDRLVRDTGWLQPYRELFGDERVDYTAALKANYENGPPADWALRHISSYASTHPWEDWAETWAHYLHIVDSLETALGYGIDTYNLETEVEPFSREDLYAPDDPGAPQALAMINSWLELTTVLNELVRSMGQPDFYPFVLSRPVVRKLHFVHLVARSAGQA